MYQFMNGTVNGAINFNGPMIQAILDGRKTETRRICDKNNPSTMEAGAPNHRVGDAVVAREEHRLWLHSEAPLRVGIEYKQGRGRILRLLTPTDHYREFALSLPSREGADWRLPAMMPPWASRVLIRIDAIERERLWHISQDAAKREGLDSRDAFLDYAEELWGEELVSKNPWVFAYRFTVLWSFQRASVADELDAMGVSQPTEEERFLRREDARIRQLLRATDRQAGIQ